MHSADDQQRDGEKHQTLTEVHGLLADYDVRAGCVDVLKRFIGR